MKFIKEYGELFTAVLLLLTYLMATPSMSNVEAGQHLLLAIIAIMVLWLSYEMPVPVIKQIVIIIAWLIIIYHCREIYMYVETLQLKTSPLAG